MAAFDEAKYEYFSDTRNFNLPKPFEVNYEIPVYEDGQSNGVKSTPVNIVHSTNSAMFSLYSRL
jgi:hypothetical protein